MVSSANPFEVRVEVIKVFHSVDIAKIFFIQQFIDSYSTVSNQRINNIKKIFILLLLLNLNYVYAQSVEPDVFVQSTVNRASKVLGDDLSKNQKIKI